MMTFSTKSTFFVSLLLLCTFHVSAQQHAMNAMRMHQQAHNNHVRMHQQFMHMHQMSVMNQGIKKYAGKYKFSIINLEGDTIQPDKKVKVVFDSPMNELKVKLAKKDTIFTPAQTRELLVKNRKEYIKGIPHQDSWKFRTLETGGIGFYAPYPETEINFLTHYQLPNDTLTPLTSENMALLMKGNEKAEKALKKNKQEKAIKIFIKDELKKQKQLTTDR